VLNVVTVLESRGFQISRIKPEEDGSLKSAKIEQAINERTGLISLMHGNNEIGNINIMKEIGGIAKRHDVLFHSDAAQTFGKIAIDVDEMNIHLLSISGHKIYGPKGIGALYVRRENPRVKIEPILFGGGQEEGLRPGTLAVPLIVGLGEAAKIAGAEMKVEVERIDQLRSRLLSGLQAKCPDMVLNGSMKNRLPHCINISFLGIDSDALMNNLRSEIAVSNGSACNSYAPMPSHVLEAIGAEKERARSAIRFGLGRFTTEEEIDYTIDCVSEVVKKLRGVMV
jgi:cysteine desulfurase